MKKMAVILILAITSLVFVSFVCEAGKYENVKTGNEKSAEMRAKDLSLLKRNIGRQFCAKPIDWNGQRQYPVFREMAQKGSREFRVLENEDFTIKEFIVGGVETEEHTVGDTWYRRRIIFKIQFKSGKIGFIDLGDLVEGYICNIDSKPEYILGENNCIISPKSRDRELDDVFIKLADWRLFRESIW
jgi:hypothetical protein